MAPASELYNLALAVPLYGSTAPFIVPAAAAWFAPQLDFVVHLDIVRCPLDVVRCPLDFVVLTAPHH